MDLMVTKGFENKVSVSNVTWNAMRYVNKPADKISFFKWNFNNILSIAVLRVSVKKAKQELEKSREKIHNWRESGNEIPVAGQFYRKIINTCSVLYWDKFYGWKINKSIINLIGRFTRAFRWAETFSKFVTFHKANLPCPLLIVVQSRSCASDWFKLENGFKVWQTPLETS